VAWGPASRSSTATPGGERGRGLASPIGRIGRSAELERLACAVP
jgi:hypothetical protein